MYESFFGLVRRPFVASADADCYYPATAIETARQTLFRCIDRGEGAALLIGPAGAGKSLLLQVLAEQFRGRFGIALLGSGRFNNSIRAASCCRRSSTNSACPIATLKRENCGWR
jgi:hypothetical protein